MTELAKQLANMQRTLLDERTNAAFAMIPHKADARAFMKSLLWVEFEHQIKTAGAVPSVGEIVDFIKMLIARDPRLAPEKKSSANLTQAGIDAKVRQALAAAYELKR